MESGLWRASKTVVPSGHHFAAVLYVARGDGMMGATSTEAKEKKRKRDKDRRAEKRKL